ncbi:AMP-binding protein [Actinomadura sp. CNU-125]|uniref:AMP-binding protein n=1 Tax=Actinomadura sp. CNU-125 TaxID=1904961 RepID=UPI0009FB4BD1|nr:AMP-binding protein [Actinomadura sp. CNU-125]
MPTLLDRHIAHDGDGIAVADDDGALSWARLGERVNRWSDLFARRGLRPGDRVACVLGNRRETFEVLLACLHGASRRCPSTGI